MESLICARRVALCALLVTATFTTATRPGHARSFPAEVNLEVLRQDAGGDGTEGFTMVSDPIGASSRLGRYVSSVGDLNDDGLQDFAISDAAADQAYVVFGRSDGFPATLDLNQLLPENGGDGSRGFVLLSSARPRFTDAGDTNDDGIDDMMWAATADSEVYILLGTDAPFPPAIAPDDLNNTPGVSGSVLFVADEPDIFLGDPTNSVGDVNGDGHNDFLIRASAASECIGGRTLCVPETFLLYGVEGGFGLSFDLSSLRAENGGDGSLGASIVGALSATVDGRGDAVAQGAGDLNDDGFDDLVFSAPDNINFDGSRSYLLFGGPTLPAEIDLSTLQPENGGDGSLGVTFNSDNLDEVLELDALALGDINDDGIDDLLLGTARSDENELNAVGRAYLLYGRSTPVPAQFDWRTLHPDNGGDGSEGVVFETAIQGDGVGYSLAGEDINGDGLKDLLIAASRLLSDEPGLVFALFGTTAPLPPLVDLRELLPENGANGERGTVFRATSARAFDSVQVAGIGDTNGDGINDILIGATEARGADEGFVDFGEGYVVFGRLPAPLNVQIIGLNLSLGACRNVGTDQTVSVGLPEFALDESWNCTDLGLDFAPNDQLVLQGEGTNFGTAINGVVVGLAPGGNVTCTADDSGEQVTVDIAADGTWDCEAAGLTLPNQTAVTVAIRGVGAEIFPAPSSISLTLTGMDTRTVACQNLTDPQTVTGVLAEVRLEETINCEQLGLTAGPGDTVTIQGRGRNFGTALSGSFEELVDELVIRCENTTQGEVRFVTLEAGDSSFDCAASGLPLNNQDDVVVTLRGALEAPPE